MPQSSDEMRELMRLLFGGSGVDSAPPAAFLKSRGYRLSSNWLWTLPEPDHSITEKEALCLRFLVEEWDYGVIDTSGAAP